MAFRISRKKSVNVKRVVTKIAVSVLALYVGGTILTEIGNVMNGTSSPFYKGLTLLGWTVGANPTNGSAWSPVCAGPGSLSFTSATSVGTTCITSTTGSGILTVVGLVAIAAIVMEFVDFSF